MAIAGILSMSAQAFSMDIDEAMKTKSVDIPTLEYLKTNDVLIPQKDGDPIKSPGSAYTIEKIDALSGDENNIEFTYTTSDKDGKLTDSYYKVNYEGKIPDGYTVTSTRIHDTLTQEAVTNVVFKDISGASYGGAIYNIQNKPDVNIIADFINNSADYGGAIYNYNGTIGDITGDFINNSAGDNGGAIDNGGTIGNITGDFINNSANSTGSQAYGGALINWSTIGDIIGDFINNSAISISNYAQGGAIYNGTGAIGSITGNFISNSAIGTGAEGGALRIFSSTGNITGNFINNSATGSLYAFGGAIYNGGAIGAKDDEGNIVGGIINSSFLGNYAKSEGSTAQGGAIYRVGRTTPLNLISQDGYTSVIKDNYTESKGVRDDNAIYLNNSTLNFQMKNGGKFYVADNIDGDATKTNTVNIIGDSVDNTMFYMLNDIRNSAVNVGATTLNTINNDIHTYNFKSLTLTDNVNMLADVDLENQVMDRFTANNYGTHNGNLNVQGMNLLNDAPEDREITVIYFAQNGLKDNVTHNGLEIPNETYQNFEAYTPIYKYNVTYSTDYAETNSTEDNQLEDGGYFLFTKGDKYVRPTGGTTSTGNPSDAFNPSVLASPVATQLGGYLTMLNTYDEAFRNMDMYMLMTRKQRQALKLRNRYASASDNIAYDKLNTPYSSGSVWMRPFTTFESVPLKNGPKVSNVAYGSYFGAESEMYDLGHGWDGMWSLYAGYNGSHQSFNGVSIYQNGGVLGAVGMAYKGNYFVGGSINVGANAGEASTMYGQDNFAMLMTGAAVKTGYNIELADGKFIIQPNYLMSYTLVNTFDYTNAAGVKINSDPLNAIHLEPGLKFIGNLKNGWQPYLGVSMIWNIMDKTDFRANNVALPDLSIKPFVKYGVGVRKTIGDRFVGYLQTYLTNGGRNGVGIQLGLRWNIGK